MKRVMCVYLPWWPLQCLWQARPDLRDKPTAIVEERPGKGSQVVLCCRRALQAGVRVNMPLAEALAVQPRLAWRQVSNLPGFGETGESGKLETCRHALEHLAAWAQRYSPIVGLEEGPAPESLLADVTGCAACFGGEERLAQRAARKLKQLGYTARIALADTVGAAWALARCVRNFHIVPPLETEKALAPLPIAVLRLPDQALHILAELGIKRIGELSALPRSELPDRLGTIVLQRLDQALGRLLEPIVPHHALPEVRASCSFEYPTTRRNVLHYALDRLLERIEAMLRERHRGARQLECWFYHESAEPDCVEVGLFRPNRSAQHLGTLLRTRLEQVWIAEPVSGLCLRVPAVESVAEVQGELFDTEGAHSASELPILLDRLASRLGRDAVAFARLVPDPQPEYACRFDSAIRSWRAGSVSDRRTDSAEANLRTSIHRPLQLWPMPAPITVRAVVPEGPPFLIRQAREEYKVVGCWGPERIETGWWRGQDVHRDYYIVETDAGTRLWIFRRHEDDLWFLHGSFE